MKKLLLAGGALAMLLSGQKAGAQAFSVDFNSGLPATWLTINDGHAASIYIDSVLFPPLTARLTAKAWDTVSFGNGNYGMMTTSWFDPAAQADRWLISQSFQVTSTSNVLQWDDWAYNGNYPDSMQVLIATNAGTTPADFTSIYNQKGTVGGFSTHVIDLSSHIGETVRIAFRDHSTDEEFLFLDNVKVFTLPSSDIKLDAISPANGNAGNAYAAAGGGVTISGRVSNQGLSNITSYTAYYQQGSNAPVSQTFTANIPVYGTANFTFTTPVPVPTIGAYPVNVWVTTSGDVNHSNDSATTSVNAVSFMPSKKLAFEEGTGTWCGYCVRGIVYMDSLRNAHGSSTSLIAVHDQDPMALSDYDAFMSNLIGYSYPTVSIDRREFVDPADIIDVYNAEHNYFGFADVTLGALSTSGNTISLPVTVRPAMDLSGDYRLALVLTEDRVHGVTDANHAWDQHNYYANAYSNGALGSLSNAEYNFNTLPYDIPDATMKYDFVARSISGTTTGTAGSLPATMTTGTDYSYNFTTTIDPSWNTNNMHAVVMLIRNSDGQVLNSNNVTFPLGIQNIAASINNMSVFPNPAHGNATLHLELKDATEVSVIVTDVTGREVYSNAVGHTAAGDLNLNIPTANFANGMYNVTVKTTSGTASQRLSVVK